MAGTRHREYARAVVAQHIRDAIVLELAFDGFAGPPGPIAAWVAPLDDEVRLVAMEGQSVVETTLAEFNKVGGGKGRVVFSERCDDDAFGGVEGCGSGHNSGFSW